MTGETTLAAAEEEPRYGWVVVWATFAALAVIFGVAYSFAAFFESFAAEFSARRAQVSLVFGLSGLLYFVLGAFGGMLADRFGPSRVSAAGMVCIALGLLGSSLAQSMTQVTLAYGIGAGTLVVPLLAAWAIVALQWRGALQALALAVLLLGLGAAALLRRAPAATAAAGRVVAGATLREALRTPAFRWMYATAVLAAPSMFIPFAHVSAAARDAGIADAQAVGLVGLIGIGSLTGRFVIGALADRLGRPLTLITMQAALGASFLLWAAAGGRYPVLAAFAVCVGLSYGGIVSLLPALAMDLFGARAVASIIGTLYTGAAFGNLAGPWLAGWMFDRSGSYAGVIWGCVALSAAATLTNWLAVRRRA